MNDRIVIIGGGIIGLLCGRELLHRGYAVTILEGGTLQGSASTGNAGVISPGHPPIPTPEVAAKAFRMLLDRRSPLYIPPRASLPLLRWLLAFRRACRPAHFKMISQVLDQFSMRSRELFDPLVQEAPHALDASGFAEIVRTKAGQQHLAMERDRLEQSGFEVELQDGDTFREQDPGWDPSVRAALIHRHGIVTRPDLLIQHLSDQFTAEGGQLRTGCQVIRVHRQRNRFESVELNGGERVEADGLLLAAGIWTTRLVKDLGIRIPMQAAKGYHVMIEMKSPPRRAALLQEACVVVNPMGDQVRIAGTLELSGINDRMVTRRVNMLQEAARDYVPGIDEAPRRSEWNGLRPCTADGLPAIGLVPGMSNAFVATGHAMMGVTLGPGTAELVAGCIEGQALPNWAEPMNASRFA
ncbi:MAG: FAD-dependent oxidoreductase [Phycisphaerales bacterium]|nr:FAD-dependent oxidoreductase [Phycisphaerales bacterium]